MLVLLKTVIIRKMKDFVFCFSLLRVILMINQCLFSDYYFLLLSGRKKMRYINLSGVFRVILTKRNTTRILNSNLMMKIPEKVAPKDFMRIVSSMILWHKPIKTIA